MAAIFRDKDDDKDSNTEKIETVIKEGWAIKESGQVVLGQTNWRRRFFRLVRLCRHQNGDVVVVWSYFRKIQDVNSNQPAGSIELNCEYVARELESGEKKRKPNCFALGPLYDRLSKRTYYVSCDNEEEKLTWMEVINAAAEIPSANAVKYEKRRNSIRKRMTRRSKKHHKTMEVCPVPTDSASYLDGRWRLEQWKNLKAVVHSGQWKKSDVKNGISLSNMSFKRTDYAALKVEGIIPVHPGIAYDYLQRAFQPGGKLDQIFRNEKSLQTLDSLLPEATVVYNRYSVPLPGAAGRDACLMKMWVPMYLTGDGTCGLVIMSVSHPTVPQPKDTVRVQIELSGFVLSPIRNSSGSTTHTRATVVSQIDLQDSLQSMLEGTFKSGLLKIGIRTAFSYISDQIQQFCAILQ